MTIHQKVPIPLVNRGASVKLGFLGKCNPQPKWHLDRFRRFGTADARGMGDWTNIAHRPSTHARHAVAMRTVR